MTFAILLALGAGFAGATAASAAEGRTEMLVDFTDNHRDREGNISHPYEYVFGEWNAHVFDLPRRGALVKAPNGKGGLGENRTAVGFEGDGATLHFVIGNANRAKAVAFGLEDRDGTEQTWVISLAGLPPGRELAQRLDLSNPTREDKPGKKPGLNLKKISTWQLKGDWTDANVEVLFIKLTGEN